MHLNDGQLRASIDHEADTNTITHLASCAECRRRADEMSAQSQRIAAHFDALSSQDSRETSAHVALARLKAKNFEERKEIVMNRIFNRRNRTAWVALGIVVVLAISLTLPPVQAWAEGMLAQFRVKSIVVLPVDTTGLESLNNNATFAHRMSQLVSDSTKVTKESGKPQFVANASEASKLAGFSVRLPSNQANPSWVMVQGGAAFEFVVNRARAQSLLAEAGFGSTQLPASIDKATIKVNVPSGVSVAYGDCPKPDATSTSSAKPAPKNCLVVAQMPSPTVDTPPNVELTELAEIGLQFTGMTKDQARAFAKNVDWTSTLVVPIPRNGSSYKQVQIDGAQGNLIETNYYGSQYTLVWVKNNIIHVIEGSGDSANAITMANAMK
jgi:hypothetical protein